MGFIRAALSSGLNSFNDSKFKEAIVLPNNLTADALAIKGQLLTKDPDGTSRQSNQNTGLLTDGSVVIVPQGYVAILVNNGTFLGDVLEAGNHEWRSEDNAWLLEKGGIKGTWENFKNRFSFGGQVITQQEIIFIRMQPIAGNKFGTQNAVEYFSERYQQLLNIRFYGLFDIKVADPVLFYVSSISQQIEDHRAFTLKDIAQGTLRQNISPKIAIAIAKFTNENRVDIYSLNANQDTFNDLANKKLTRYGLDFTELKQPTFLLEDLSYDQESLNIIRKLDSELVAMKYNTIEIEERRARNEALIVAANNEGNGNGMNIIMGMNLGQTLGGQLNQQTQAPIQNNGQTASKNFYIEVDGKYVLVTKDEEGNIVPVN